MNQQHSVRRFFDSLSHDYTATIERCFPRYREMLWALLDYLPPDAQPRSILELGCGTGNLSVLLGERFPDANIRFVDLSQDSLDVCQQRLGSAARFEFEPQDFRDLAYPRHRFDLVVSSIALHHLVASEKRLLFRDIHEWLTTDGLLAYADQFAGATPDLHRRHIQNWKELSLAAGAQDDEWDMWMRHQADHDHHDTLIDQINWLTEARFSAVDAPWRYLLWTVVQARKESC